MRNCRTIPNQYLVTTYFITTIKTSIYGKIRYSFYISRVVEKGVWF